MVELVSKTFRAPSTVSRVVWNKHNVCTHTCTHTQVHTQIHIVYRHTLTLSRSFSSCTRFSSRVFSESLALTAPTADCHRQRRYGLYHSNHMCVHVCVCSTVCCAVCIHTSAVALDWVRQLSRSLTLLQTEHILLHHRVCVQSKCMCAYACMYTIHTICTCISICTLLSCVCVCVYASVCVLFTLIVRRGRFPVLSSRTPAGPAHL